MSRNAEQGNMLDKAMEILECFGPSGTPLRLSELVERSKLPKTTVHRLTGELLRLGLLDREGTGFRLGGRLFELGSLVPHRRDLRESAVPFMQDLFEATHETIHLGVREAGQVVYVERIHGHATLPLPSRVGGSLPLSCTAVGKALLAFSGTQVVDEVLAQPLPSLTPRSITDPSRLRRILEAVAASGLAYEREESAVGISCIAAPVFSGTEVVAALSVAMPDDRFDPAVLAPAVRTAALGLSRQLRVQPARRFTPPPPMKAP